MPVNNTEFITSNKVFCWMALATLSLLAIPFVLMQYKIPLYDPGSGQETINWDLADFILMGGLIFGTGSLFVLFARKIPNKFYRIALAAAFFLGFLWIWAELAVGIFTDWGS